MNILHSVGKTCLLWLILALSWASVAQAASVAVKPEVALRQAFPQLPFESIEPADIRGLYTVVSGANVFYFYPEKDLLFVGEIYRTGGESITAEKRREIAAALVKGLPLDKAVKIGKGEKVVIEFTDPDCPYCRKASEFFSKRADVTRYVFFAPFAHPQAITKVHYILNAGDKAQAYHDMMGGKAPVAPAGGYSESVKALAQEHTTLARRVGVEGTPTFFVDGTQVVGADIPQLERLLKGGAK